jgi:hypothetical protein
VVLLDQGKVRLDCDLDEIREDLCVAIVPQAWLADAAALERVAGCLRVRPLADEWHAVFHGSSDEVRRRLEPVLGAANIECMRVPLEDLFIELVGGKHAGVSS